MKRKLICILSLVCVLALGFAAACNETPETGTNGYSITLSQSALALNRFTTQEINANIYLNGERTEGETLSWQSSDEKVATVTNGKVFAVDDGRAVITATHASGASATCSVTVTTSQIPMISMRNDIAVLVDDSVNVGARLVFNDEDTSAAEFTYSADDETIATVDETGSVTGVGPGTTKVRVSVSWQGYSAVGTADVSVKEDVEVAIDSEAVTIYSNKVEIEGETYTNETTLEAVVQTGGGEDRTDGTIEWFSEDETVATVENGTVRAVNPGKTAVYFEYATDLNPDFPYASNKIEVTVQYPSVTKNDIFVDADQSVSSNPLNGQEIFGKAVTVTGAYLADDAAMENNYYVGGNLNAAELPTGEMQMLISNSEGYGYVVNVTVATKIFYELNDLLNWQDEYAEATLMSYGLTLYNSDAYFLLGDDIDGQNATMEVERAQPTSAVNGSVGNSVANNGGGFMGTFDGRGHTIRNLTLGSGGIFGDIGKGAVIKNTAFENITLVTDAAGMRPAVLGYVVAGATIENCYFEVQSSSRDASTLGGIVTRYTMKNCVIVSDIQANGESGAVLDWNPNYLRDENNNPYDNPQYYTCENSLVIYKNDYKVLSGSRKTTTLVGVVTADYATADKAAIEESGFNYGALGGYFDTTGAIPVFK